MSSNSNRDTQNAAAFNKKRLKSNETVLSRFQINKFYTGHKHQNFNNSEVEKQSWTPNSTIKPQLSQFDRSQQILRKNKNQKLNLIIKKLNPAEEQEKLQQISDKKNSLQNVASNNYDMQSNFQHATKPTLTRQTQSTAIAR